MTKLEFNKLTELDRFANERAWFNLCCDAIEKASQAAWQRDTAETKEDYNYFDDLVKVNNYYYNLYFNNQMFCGLQ